jgi:hypothetical protein
VVDWPRDDERGEATVAESIHVGDRVSWNTPQGRTHGEVVERRTADFELAGQGFTASADEPAFVVRSEKSGKEAAHQGSALRRLRD